MSGSFSTSETDVIEMSYPTRGGNLLCARHYDPIMNSYINNENGIISILTLLMNLMNSKIRQKSSPFVTTSFMMFPVAFIDIALSPHEEHKGMTNTVLIACKETHVINPLWLSLITICMFPPQKQEPPNSQSFDIYICTCMHACTYIYIK